MDLTAVEVRVLGCLLEKEATTPQYYPLTVNALVNACNQSSNRFPVVRYDEATVSDALRTLRERGLTRVVHSVHNRAAKHRHVLPEVWSLSPEEAALLCVLMLRGPQTAAELRARAERMADVGTLDRAAALLDGMAARDEPLLMLLPRQPGQKEQRYVHLLGGEPDMTTEAAAPARPVNAGGGGGSGERVDALEAEVASLRAELREVRADLGEVGTELRRLRDELDDADLGEVRRVVEQLKGLLE